MSAYNPSIVYVSISGYGQSTSWRGRPAFAPTVQCETGHTSIVHTHYGAALSAPMNDAASHADVYTGLQGVIAVLAALEHRHKTGKGQHVDVSMAATMLSVNERAGALLSEIDTEGEPIALSANESHIYELPGGKRLTIAASPIYTPMFMSYCGMMRRTDLLVDPRFATARLRRTNLDALLAEVRAWILTFEDLAQLQTQVSEAGLAVGEVRSITEFAKMDWVKEWNAIVEVDDRNGGTTPMPGAPWIFSGAELASAGRAGLSGRAQCRDLRGSQCGARGHPKLEGPTHPSEPPQHHGRFRLRSSWSRSTTRTTRPPAAGWPAPTGPTATSRSRISLSRCFNAPTSSIIGGAASQSAIRSSTCMRSATPRCSRAPPPRPRAPASRRP